MSESYISNLLYEACKNGDLEACKWLHDSSSYLQCECNIAKCSIVASENGYLSICQWLYETYYFYHTSSVFYNIFNLACINNHYEICEWLYDEDIYVKDYGDHFKTVCEHGYFSMAQWIYDIDPKNALNEINYTLYDTYENGHLSICEWLIEICPTVKFCKDNVYNNGYDNACKFLQDHKKID
jgi:hypothetical protein